MSEEQWIMKYVLAQSVGHGSVVGSFDVRPFSLMGWAGPARFCPTGYFEDFNVIYRLLTQHL